MSCSYDRELAYLALRDIESGSSWSNLALKQRLGGGKPGPEKKEAGSPAFVRELKKTDIFQRTMTKNIHTKTPKPNLFLV